MRLGRILTRERYDEIIGPALGGDPVAQRELFAAHRPLVVSIVKPFAGRAGVDLDDLVQEGNLALIYALSRFDPAREVSFGTYAAWWVRAAAQQATRNTLVGKLAARSDKRLAPRIGEAWRVLAQRLGRAPTTEELAEEAGGTREELEQLLGKLIPPSPVAEDWNEDGDFVPASRDVSPEYGAELREALRAVQQVLEEAPERSRTMFVRHVFGEEPLRDIGRDYGVSGERVRQIIAALRERMREIIELP